MMQRVLVTGAAGFIGSHIVDRLVADGHEVAAIDRIVPDDERCNPAAKWIEADLRDRDTWMDYVDSSIDAVSHQAAMVGLGVDLRDIRGYVDDNDVATASGLWALHELGWRGQFVLASSMVVYGEGLYRCSAGSHERLQPPARAKADLDAERWDPPCPHCGAPLEWQPIEEDAPTDPRNVYAATKLHQEHLLSAFAREHGMGAVALRYHNVYGPRLPLNTPYAGVAALFRSRLEAGSAPRVFEDGGQTRDFVHVHDVAKANALALAGDRAPGLRAYNIASGRPVSILGVAQTLSQAMDGPEPEVVGGYRLGDVRHIVASPARAERELGFRAAVQSVAAL